MSDQHSLTSDPVLKSWSREQLESRARDFMVREFGKPTDMPCLKNRRRWHEKLGLLVQFTNDLWGDQP